MHARIGIILALTLILSSPAYAWIEATQEHMADLVCQEFPECNGTYNEVMKEYSMYVDRWYIYPLTYPNHLNYYPDPTCPEGPWVCPDFYDQGSLYATAEHLNASYQLEGKEKWKQIAIASHYYMESKEFWHHVMNENYYMCHDEMEEAFDERFLNNETDFEVCVCGICENTTELYQLRDEFVKYIQTETVPEARMDDATFFHRSSRFLNDMRLGFYHKLKDFVPTVRHRER